MKLNKRVALALEANEQCKAELAEVVAALYEPGADTEALRPRITKLRLRVDRLDVEVNRLLREYGLDPDLL